MELQFQKELELRQLFLFISINKITQTVTKMRMAIGRKFIIQFI